MFKKHWARLFSIRFLIKLLSGIVDPPFLLIYFIEILKVLAQLEFIFFFILLYMTNYLKNKPITCAMRLANDNLI